MKYIRRNYMVAPEHSKRLNARAIQKKHGVKSASELLRKFINEGLKEKQ